MIPVEVIIAIDGAGVAGALLALAGLLARPQRFRGAPKGLMAGLTGLLVAWGAGNLLEWTHAVPRVDLAENFFAPLLPVLWLFLFIIVPEQQTRHRLSRSVDRLAALHRLAVDLVAATDPQTIMDEVVAQAGRLLRLPVVAVLTPDDSGRRLRTRASLGLAPDDAERLTPDADRDLAAQALDLRAPVQARLSADQVPPEALALVRRHGLTHLVAVPLLTDEETVGVLAAHDFNNLLSAILGSAGLLRESLAEDSEDHEAAIAIEQAARRGTELGRQLMDLGRREPPRTEPVNLNHIAEEARHLLERTLPGGVRIVTRLRPHLRTIRGDPGQMHQVLMNLALNARDAMGRSGTLTLATENVDLDGDGPFVTSKETAGGTGLGLSTVYAIVHSHGGRVTFESTPGRRRILP